MSNALSRWNKLTPEQAAEEILPCCGSRAWARGMAAGRPILDERSLLAASDELCARMAESDWLEAFRSHPRIGESRVLASVTARSAAWSGEEQQSVSAAEERTRMALAEGNSEYEGRFGRTFIVCATGKTPAEMLEILRRRLRNDQREELREAAEEQRQITQIRLKKWLRS